MTDQQQRVRRWRKKAEEFRAQAQRARDAIMRESFLQTAHGYEDMARQAEKQDRHRKQQRA